jgi:uncharacterized protein involved in type VI secretion and phage assembly
MSGFFGKYRGVVTDNADPERRGRVKARVQDVTGDDSTGWAEPCLPFTGAGVGFYGVPKVGAAVWIEFEQGNPEKPIVCGGRPASLTEVVTQLLPFPDQKVLLLTAGGQSILLDDTPGIGGIVLETSGGQKLKLTATGIEIDNGMGGTIKLTGPQVSVNNGALEVT